MKCDLDMFSRDSLTLHCIRQHMYRNTNSMVVCYSEHSHKKESACWCPENESQQSTLVTQRHAIRLQIFHFKMSKCIPLAQSKLILSYSSALKGTLRRKRANRLDLNQAAHLLLIEEHNSPLSDTRKRLLQEI